MKILSIWVSIAAISICNLVAQDTIQLNCSNKITGLTSSPIITIKMVGTCDSIFLLNKRHYHFLLNESKNFKEFYSIFQQYKSTRKSSNSDIANLISDYEKIMTVKDDAYNALLNEYENVNKLLDTSIDQNRKSLEWSETNLKDIKSINSKLLIENQQLADSISKMKNIHAKEKLKAGVKGGIMGGAIAIVLCGIIGAILIHN